MVVDHPQTALDGKVVVAENVGPLHTEQQNHLRRPNTDALQGAQFADGVLVAFLPDALRIERTAVDALGKIGDVLRLAKGHAQRLQFGNTGSQDRLGVHGAQCVLHSLPDRGLRLRRDLLADDVVHHRRKQIGIDDAVHMPDFVDDLTQPLVPGAQAGKLGFPVGKKHRRSLLYGVGQYVAQRQHGIAHAFGAGAERHAGGNALQLLADSRAAPLLKAPDQCACHSGRAAALRQDAGHHHSADQCAAGALQAAHTGSVACRQHPQGVALHGQLVLKYLYNRLGAVALPGGF